MASDTTPPALTPFRIHCVDTTTYMLLQSLDDLPNMTSSKFGAVIRDAHRQLVADLSGAGIDYQKLNPALVPKPERYEVAFVFDSTQAPDRHLYGYSFAEVWIPILKRCGPQTSTYSLGDVGGFAKEQVWEIFEKGLVGRRKDFPRLYTSTYYVLYVSNMTVSQVNQTHGALLAALPGYLGFVNCTTWNPFKLGLLLPQVGLRCRDTILTSADEDGKGNLPGYPFEENGYRVVGVTEYLYETLLSHRMDHGVPDWAAEDSSFALTALTGSRKPLATTTVVVSPSRLEYLKREHGPSLERVGLADVTEAELAEAIRGKFEKGLIFNLRFVAGEHNGVPDPKLDALMYSVQVELPTVTETGVKRFQVGLKYTPATHTSEVVTFY